MLIAFNNNIILAMEYENIFRWIFLLSITKWMVNIRLLNWIREMGCYSGYSKFSSGENLSTLNKSIKTDL